MRHAAVARADRRVWLVTFAVVSVVYALTAHWYGIVNDDTFAAALPGWVFAHHGTLAVDSHAGPQPLWEFVHAHGHLVSNRMAGVVLVGIPAQLALAPLGTAPLTAAVLTGVLTTAAGVACLVLLLSRLTGSRPLALAVGAAMAFGTGLWTTAGAELWTHGPDVLWCGLALLALQKGRMWGAGVALVPALWTRPHLAVAVAVLGATLVWRRRSLRPAWALGLPAVAALVSLVAWNAWLFGRATLAGGYDVGGGYTSRATTLGARPVSALRELGVSVAGTLVSPLHGALVYSPFLLVGAVALVWALRAAPDWALGAALAGLAYQAVQWRLNGFTGGAGQYAYRLPLEWLFLSAPAATVGYLALRRAHPRVRVLVRWLVAASVTTMCIGAFWYRPLAPGAQHADPWTSWEPLTTVLQRGPAGVLVASALAAAVVAGCLVPSPRWTRLLACALPSLVGPRDGAGPRGPEAASRRLVLSSPRP